MSDLNIRKEGKAGRITLTRVKAMNALSHDMCLQIEQALRAWAQDDDVTLVLVDADGDKAFCAGGDIVKLYEEGRSGRDDNARRFWRDEYRLNALIHSYAKPYVPIMDGFVMGGGVGISAHGSHRVVTENTLFALPECAIGLITDVGGSFLLSRMPGHSGDYAGLTSARLSGADCIYGGLADHFVPRAHLPALKQALCDSGDIGKIVEFSAPSGPSELSTHRDEIDALFAPGSVTDIQAACAGSDTDFGRNAAKALARNAPLAVCASHAAIAKARDHQSLREALRIEYRFVREAVLKGEFLEGIRAAVIDKDRTPHWKYDTFGAVPQRLIEQLFHPTQSDELEI